MNDGSPSRSNGNFFDLQDQPMMPATLGRFALRAKYGARNVLRAFVAISTAIWSNGGHYAGRVIVAGFGAFAGTIAAFQLERSARQREQHQIQLIAALSARAALDDMKSTLLLAEKSLRSSGLTGTFQEDAWLIMDVQIGPLLTHRPIDYTALAFFYEGKNAHVLRALRNLETYFLTYRQTFDTRNDIMERIVLPAMSEPMEQGTQQMTEQERIIERVGYTQVSKVMFLTKQIFDTHKPLLLEVEKVSAELDAAIHDTFPPDVGK